CKRSPFAYW
nr:immunoglobulin heavy chain junction region [Mus musculus]